MITGGCQCGALRYRVGAFGRASICHCRMCQKAFGNYFAPLVVVRNIEWVRGERRLFASSNKSKRGFCSDCGTPLTLEDDGVVELAIGTLDDPVQVQPDYHANTTDRLEVVVTLHQLPDASAESKRESDDWNAAIVSYQHPDYDTANWEAGK